MEEITESFNYAHGLCSSSSGYYWLSENNGRNKVYIRETKRIILEPRLRRSVLEASNNANCHPCQTHRGILYTARMSNYRMQLMSRFIS